jgi:uncharacterized protein YutE (UPF0331/DUF86 family)
MNVRNGIIAQKLETLDKVLAELRSLGHIDLSDIRYNWQLQRIVERDLQVLVEIVIDICNRILSLSGQSPAASSGSAIERCIELGILSDDPAYRKMVQLRNIIVHRYEYVDVEILADVVNNHLPDVERFKEEILVYVQNN